MFRVTRISLPQSIAYRCQHSRQFLFSALRSRSLDPNKYNVQRQQFIHQIRSNPQMLGRGDATIEKSLSWRTVLVLVAVSSSVTMAIYVGVQMYKASVDPEDAKPRNVFLPLWISVNWPSQRKYTFPDYLKYMDEPYYRHVQNTPNFEDELHEKSVQYQVLDGLFRLTVVRDLLGIPLSLKALDDDKFEIWIEPKYPTVHGPQIHMSKENGSVSLTWRWAVKLVHWWAYVDSFLTGMGTKLDKIESSEALAKTHERGSGRVHEVVLPIEKKTRVDVGDRDYTIVFRGTFHVSHLSEEPCGVVCYTGVIDFNHLGICHGARIVQLDMVVDGEEGETIYKLT